MSGPASQAWPAWTSTPPPVQQYCVYIPYLGYYYFLVPTIQYMHTSYIHRNVSSLVLSFLLFQNQPINRSIYKVIGREGRGGVGTTTTTTTKGLDCLGREWGMVGGPPGRGGGVVSVFPSRWDGSLSKYIVVFKVREYIVRTCMYSSSGVPSTFPMPFSRSQDQTETKTKNRVFYNRTSTLLRTYVLTS